MMPGTIRTKTTDSDFLKTFTKLHIAGSNLLWNAEQHFLKITLSY